MYRLWNETDRVFASPEVFGSKREAREYARAFRERYTPQGYYLTADGFRINSKEVELWVVPFD